MGIREIKDRARRDLHRQMQVEAFYYAPKALLPRAVQVRVHNKWDAKGDQQGTSFNYGELREETPKLTFLFEQCDPDPQAVVVISDYEAYRVLVPDPRYLQTVAAACVALQPQEIAAKKYLWPERGRAVAGDATLPFLTASGPDAALDGLTASGDVALTYVVIGNVVLPGGPE